MIVNNYKKMFSIDISHSFFGEKRNGALQIIAGDVTKQLMKRFEISISNTNTGIAVYYCSKNSFNDFLSYISKSTSYDFFDFDIESSSDYFYYITDLPHNFIGRLFFNTANTSYQNVNDFELKCEIMDGSNDSKIGKLQVNFADLIKSVTESSSPNFIIRFKSRSTQWQYFVINRNNIPIDNLEISSSGNIHFIGPEEAITPSGEKALLFSSGTNMIPLQESPPYKFDLINRKPSGNSGLKTGRTIFKGLPNPNPKRFEIKSSNDKVQYSSPMYIYI